jgi:hypothetical protein
MRASSSVIRFQANIRAQPLCAKNLRHDGTAPDANVGMTFCLDVC